MQLWEVTASESLMVHLYLFSLGSIWMYCIGMNINVKSLNYRIACVSIVMLFQCPLLYLIGLAMVIWSFWQITAAS
jgi:hypothetical protein